eukprot:590481-Ditylum_brightwellii.AAC.1
MFRSIRTPLQSLRETLQDNTKDTTNTNRDTSVEGLNEGNMMYHTCLLGEQIVLDWKVVIIVED